MSEIKSLFAALKAQLSEHFGDRLKTIDEYLPVRYGTLETPAALIDIEGFDESPGDDDGTGRIPLTVHIAIHCVLGFRTKNVEIEVRAFAAEVMRILRSCPHGVGHPERLSGMPGMFRPGEQDGFEDFVITFDVLCRVGESIWEGDPWIAQEVFVGYVPRIGREHEPDYIRVDNPPQERP